MTRRHIALVLALAAWFAVLAMLLLPAPGAGASILVTDAIQAPGQPHRVCLVHEALVQGKVVVAENPQPLGAIPCPPVAKKPARHSRRRRI